MRTIHTTSLLEGISTDFGFAWSPEDKLAVAAKKGVYVYTVVPKPFSASGKLNLESCFVKNDLAFAERCWTTVDVEVDETTAVDKVRLKDILLDPCVSPDHTSEAIKQVVKLKWTPVGALLLRQSLLVLLTADHELTIKSYDGHGWSVMFNVTELLRSHHQNHNWKDCPVKIRDKDKIVEKIRARRHALATTSFVWGDVIADEDQVNSLFITGQKNGQVVVWTAEYSATTECSFRVHSILDPGMSHVTEMHWYRVSSDLFMLFMGGSDGRVKAMVVEYDGTDAVFRDVGYLWNDADRMVVKLFTVLEDNFIDALTLRLSFAKTSFLVIIDLVFDTAHLDSVSLREQNFVQVGASNIVDIQPMLGSHLVVGQDGPLYLASIPDNLAATNIAPFPTDVTFVNYRCHGFRSSSGRAIWALLQNGETHQQNPKGRIVFLTQQDTEPTIESLLNISSPHMLGLIDTLEVLRLNVLTDATSGKLHDSGQVGQLLLNIKTESGSKDKRQLHIWLCHLFISVLSMTDNVSSNANEWNTLLDILCSDALYDHAVKILKEYAETEIADFPQLQTELSSLANFVVDHAQSANAICELNLAALPEYDWKCRTCGKGNGAIYDDCLVCEFGHKWPRCFLTLQTCDTPDISQCKWCESVALANPVICHDRLCIFCSGPLVSS